MSNTPGVPIPEVATAPLGVFVTRVRDAHLTRVRDAHLTRARDARLTRARDVRLNRRARARRACEDNTKKISLARASSGALPWPGA